MTLHLVGGLLLALGSAIALGAGFFVQHEAAHSLPPISLRRPLHSMRLLFSNARWLGGYVVGIAGWGLYIAALGLAPLSIVQAVAAGGLGVLALLARRTQRMPAPRHELVGVAAAIIGLVLVASSLGRSSGSGHSSAGTIWVWLVVLLSLAGLAVLPGEKTGSRAPRMGAAAGLLYASGDIATKAAVGAGHHLVFVPVLLVCHGLGFVVLQLAFQRGSALATAGLASLMNNALPLVAGVTLFHDAVPQGVAGVVRVSGFVLAAVGAALIARAERGPSETVRAPAYYT